LIVDLKNPPPPPAPAAKKEEPKKEDTTAAKSNTASNTAAPAAAQSKGTPDRNTDALVKVELALWEAWKEHDARKLDALMARDVSPTSERRPMR
jgi:hypothetical protein